MLNDLTDGSDDATAIKKKVTADPLADAGLTVPGAANGPGSPTGAPAPTAGQSSDTMGMGGNQIATPFSSTSAAPPTSSLTPSAPTPTPLSQAPMITPSPALQTPTTMATPMSAFNPGSQTPPSTYTPAPGLSATSSASASPAPAQPADSPPPGTISTPYGYMTPEQWQNYSPMSGLTEDQKFLYSLGQGNTTLSGAGTSFAPQLAGNMTASTADKAGVFDAAGNASALSGIAAANAPEIASLLKSVPAAQDAAKASLNAGNAVTGFAQAQKDAEASAAALEGSGGAFATPQERQNYITGQLELNGFDASGNPIGGPANTQAAQAIETQFGGAGAAGTANPAGSGGALTTVPGQPPIITPPPTVPTALQGGPGPITGYPLAPGALAQPAGGATGTSTAAGTTAAPGSTTQTAQQQLESMINDYITQGRQTTANNVDPISGVTTIDPANDLRSTVITDTPSSRTTDYSNKVDQAAAALPTDRNALASSLTTQAQQLLGPTAVTAGAAVDPTAVDPRLAGIQGQVDANTANLSSIDRMKLAQSNFDNYAASTDPAYDLAIRKAKDAAAGMGLAYSGKLNTDYGNLGLARSRDLDQQRTSIFNQALSDSMNDALSKQSALTSLEGQVSGQNAATQAAQRQERDYTTNVDTGNVNRALSANETAAQLGNSGADSQIATAQGNLGALSSLEGTSRAADTTATNDLRGERANQTSQEQSAFDRALEQYQTEQGTKQQGFNNSLALLNAGEAGNPAGALEGAASTLNPSGDATAIAQLASALGKSGVQSGTAGAPGDASTGGLPSSILSYFANLLGQQQNTGAAATAGQGIDPGALAKLLASLGGSLPGVANPIPAGA